MRRLRDAALALLSRDWAGLLIALLVAAAAWVLAQTIHNGIGRALLALGLLLAALLAMASLRHLFTLAKARRAHPAPGQMVDLGGFAHAAFGLGVGDDAEEPGLLVGTRRGRAGGQQALLDHFARHRARVEVAHRATALHLTVEVPRAFDHLGRRVFAVGGQRLEDVGRDRVVGTHGVGLVAMSVWGIAFSAHSPASVQRAPQITSRITPMVQSGTS
jgi:hypothetical protein